MARKTKCKHILNVTTLEELKADYKRLALLHHPDVGSDLETMKEINNEYDALFEKLKLTHKNAEGEYYTKTATEETPDEWKEIIESLINLRMEGVTIEIIGSFIWVSGNTRQYKESLKALGFRWSSNKESWYLAPKDYKRKSRKQYEMSEIRGMFGSSRVNTEQRDEDERDRKKQQRIAQ